MAPVHGGGATGLGYTYGAAATAHVVEQQLTDVVTGLSAWDVPAANEAMNRAVRNAGRPGLIAGAVSAAPKTPNMRESAEHDAYPPQALHDYAFLADGERGALVGPRGETAWLCAPRRHSGAVFSTLIGGTGLYAVTPRGRFVPGGHYEEGSLIWRSRWVTEDGIVECREAPVLPGERRRLVLLRRVRATEGPARVRVVLHPLAEYGTQPLREARRDGVRTARVGALHLRWTGGGDASLSEVGSTGGQFTLDLNLDAGKRYDLMLELSEFPLWDAPLPNPSTSWSRTERAWSDAVPTLDNTVASRDARQAYADRAIPLQSAY